QPAFPIERLGSDYDFVQHINWNFSEQFFPQRGVDLTSGDGICQRPVILAIWRKVQFLHQRVEVIAGRGWQQHTSKFVGINGQVFVEQACLLQEGYIEVDVVTNKRRISDEGFQPRQNLDQFGLARNLQLINSG